MTTQPFDLAQLRAINDARTPSVWKYNDSRGEFQDENADPVIYGYTDYYTKEPCVEATDENIAFITAASANFGLLIDELETLRAKIAELEAQLAASQPPAAINPLHAD